MFIKDDYKIISVKGSVKSTPSYTCTEYGIDYYKFFIVSEALNNTHVSVIVAESTLGKALKQSFVDKIYREVCVWVKGVYDKTTIYAEEIILFDDMIAAREHNKILPEEYKEICDKVEKEQISFKGKIEKIKSDGIYISCFNLDFLPYNLLIKIPNDVLENTLNKAKIFSLHVSNNLLLTGDLNTLITKSNVAIIRISDAEVIEENKISTIDKEKAQTNYYYNIVKNMNLEQRKIFITRLLHEVPVEDKVETVFNSFRKKEKRKFIKKIFFKRK